MTGALTLLADHGDALSAIPFVLPALLVVVAILAMRVVERRRNTHDE